MTEILMGDSFVYNIPSLQSLFRCAGSVKPILDMVASYLPAPHERNHMVSAVFGKDLSAIVFKVCMLRICENLLRVWDSPRACWEKGIGWVALGTCDDAYLEQCSSWKRRL